MRPRPGEPRAPSSPSISPGSASRCRRMGQPSSGRAMAPGKAEAPPRARCMTSPSRLPRPTPPSGRLPPSASRLVLSSTGAARRHSSAAQAPARRAPASVPGPLSPCRRPCRLPSGRHHADPAAVALLWPPAPEPDRATLQDRRRQAERAIETSAERLLVPGATLWRLASSPSSSPVASTRAC